MGGRRVPGAARRETGTSATGTSATGTLGTLGIERAGRL